MAYIEIEIYESHVTKGGMRYGVDHGGDVLIESCRDPEHDAARALQLIDGVENTDIVLCKRRGSDVVGISQTVGWLADRSTTEGNNSGPRTIPYVPYTGPVSDDA